MTTSTIKPELPTREEVENAEWEQINGNQYQIILKDLRAIVRTDIGWMPENEASYWYAIEICGIGFVESESLPAYKNGKIRCWREVKKEIVKILETYSTSKE